MHKNKLLLIPLIASFLCGCDASHYKATVLITNNQVSQGSIQFHNLEGQYVLKLKRTAAGEGAISYTATLGTGKIEAVYKVNGGKEQPLFTITDGQALNEKAGYVEKGNKVVIILRTEGSANEGSFTFNVN